MAKHFSINHYQAERVQNYINECNNDDLFPKRKIIMVSQYSETLFEFFMEGGAKVMFNISKMGSWNEPKFDIVYHINNAEDGVKVNS